MKMYHTIEELNEDLQEETVHIARRNGCDVVQKEDNGQIWCGKHSSDEIIAVYPDGSWELQGEEISGASYTELGILFQLGKKEYRQEMNS